MEECKLGGKCVLFTKNLVHQPEIAFLMRERHCRRDFEACALYMIAAVLGADKVPHNMYPNQVAQARAIIQAASRVN